MAKVFHKSYLCAIIALSTLPIQIHASDFNIPFINASGLGNLYSDWTTSLNDASTTYTNPAALTTIHNPQIIGAALGLSGSTKFSGKTTPPPPPFGPQAGTASSALRAFMPSFYYAKPITDNIVFGFGQTAPFGLGTNYAKDSVVRYEATRTRIVVIDIGPSIGVKLTDKLSAGLGLDVNHMAFQINRMYGFPISIPDSEGQNHLSGWGYGWHGGLLHEFSPKTRIGISYNSMVMFHTKGDSEVFSSVYPFRIKTNNQRAYTATPARAQLSLHHDIHPRWEAMATVFYTNWETLDKLTLKNTITPIGTRSVTIPFGYHNTFDYSAGLNFKATDKLLLRTGVEFMQKPSNNRDRSVADPIGCATILGVGAHYQYNKRFGYDLGYAHSFFEKLPINTITPISTASGHSSSNTNILGAQVTWDMV